MSPHRRLHRIVTSLPPIEAALLFVKKMLAMGQERYLEEILAEPRNPRVLLAKMIGDAIRENVVPTMKPEVLDQAVREAQKEADMRIVLVLNLHEHVRGKLDVAHIDLLEERYSRILLQTSSVGHRPKSWDLWRAQLTDRLIEKLCLKEIVASISAEYYRGHALLFEADEKQLNSQIALLQDLMKEYNELAGCLPDFQPIDLGALSSAIAEHAERQVEHLVVLARAKSLIMFGEEQAAGELLNSTADMPLRELKRLRSLSEPQEV